MALDLGTENRRTDSLFIYWGLLLFGQPTSQVIKKGWSESPLAHSQLTRGISGYTYPPTFLLAWRAWHRDELSLVCFQGLEQTLAESSGILTTNLAAWHKPPDSVQSSLRPVQERLLLHKSPVPRLPQLLLHFIFTSSFLSTSLLHSSRPLLPLAFIIQSLLLSFLDANHLVALALFILNLHLFLQSLGLGELLEPQVACSKFTIISALD